MGYQALLVCPDDKTSRSVTQVLSELDFTVVPCTEPFAAVKKMMAEHFDAIVVDCDNEQNATLLFKSARNTPNNQSSLAVAVVEGQAGVAKAFRIGANLVLTKPINVEQAKGTLRVARGLLRKNEAAKTANPAAAAPAKAAPAAPSAKPATKAPTPIQDTKAASPNRPMASGSVTEPMKAAKTFPSNHAVSTSAESDEPEIELLESNEQTAVTPETTPRTSAPAIASELSTAAKKPAVPATVNRPVPASAASSAASAPAPARDPKSASDTEMAAAPTETAKIAESKPATESSATAQTASSAVPSPAPSFTFGGAIESGSEAGKSGSRKILLAVAAVVLIAAGAYFAYMQFGSSIGKTSQPVAVQPAKIPPATPEPTAAADVPASSATTTDTTASATVTETAAKPSSAWQPDSTSTNAASSSASSTNTSSTNTSGHSAKPDATNENTKSSGSTPAESKPLPKAQSQPLVIKSGTAPAKIASPDAAAPSLDGIAVSGAAPMNNLMVGDSKAPAPVLQAVNVSQGVSQGLLIKKTAPAYPPNAMRMRVEGSVQLLATVSGKGDVTAVKVLSGDKMLAQAATEAVKQWKYKPYLLNGSPVEIQTEITVKFKLPQ